MYLYMCAADRIETKMTTKRSGLFIVLLYYCSAYVGCDLLTNVNDAIIHNLNNEYPIGPQQTGDSGIVTFIHEIFDMCNTRIVDVTNSRTTNTTGLLQNCEVTSYNITECRKAVAEHCISPEDIIQRVNASALELRDMFPALLHSLTNPSCEHGEPAPHGHQKTPSWKAWLYGSLFCLLLCLISNIGAFMVPCMKTTYFHRFLLFCVGIAVGTMAGTGFLILIPESMGLTDEDTPVPDYRYKLSCSLGAIYFFFVCEKFLKKVFKRQKVRSSEHDVEMDVGQGMATQDADGQKAIEQNGMAGEPESAEKGRQKKKVTIATVAYVLMTGDSLHKFVDGVSVGAAFTENVYVGFSVGLAIVCEELPHELGDIAILLQSGVPMKKALIVNTLTGAVSFIGVVVGILLGENTDANMWIFAIAGGMFIYIALIDMIPAMDAQVALLVNNVKERELQVFLIQHSGLILGFVIMLLVSIYSGDINL